MHLPPAPDEHAAAQRTARSRSARRTTIGADAAAMRLLPARTPRGRRLPACGGCWRRGRRRQRGRWSTGAHAGRRRLQRRRQLRQRRRRRRRWVVVDVVVAPRRRQGRVAQTVTGGCPQSGGGALRARQCGAGSLEPSPIGRGQAQRRAAGGCHLRRRWRDPWRLDRCGTEAIRGCPCQGQSPCPTGLGPLAPLHTSVPSTV